MQKRSPERTIDVVGAVILSPEDQASQLGLDSCRVLIVQRSRHDKGGGLWEFPGGKIEAQESPEQALLREIDEELGIGISIVVSLGKLVHDYPKLRIHLEVFVCKWISGELVLREHQDLKWILPKQIDKSLLLGADQPFVERLLEYYHSQS